MVPPEDFAGAGNAEEIGETVGFGPGDFAAGGGEAVIAAALAVGSVVVAGRVDFFNEFFVEEGLHGAVEGAWTKAHASAALLFDLTHNAIAVAVLAGKGEENLEGGGGERVEFAFRHSRLSI
jgi:hypothetical protein